MPREFKGEKVNRKLKTKVVYDYLDTEAGIKQKSSEIYLNKDMIVHYPRGFKGGDKYKTIKKFTFIGYEGKLPVGINKTVNYGWGFTKTLKPFGVYLDDNYEFKQVVIEKNGKTDFNVDSHILYLSEKALRILHNTLSAVLKMNRAEVAFSLITVLNKLFPNEVEKPEKTYIENALASSLNNGVILLMSFPIQIKRQFKISLISCHSAPISLVRNLWQEQNKSSITNLLKKL